jgi:hypothetical protein
MITKPCRIWRLGAIFPASLPLSQAPDMMPEMVSKKNQKNCVWRQAQVLAQKRGRPSTYRNMPLNGTPLASASSRKRGLAPSCQ